MNGAMIKAQLEFATQALQTVGIQGGVMFLGADHLEKIAEVPGARREKVPEDDGERFVETSTVVVGRFTFTSRRLVIPTDIERARAKRE